MVYYLGGGRDLQSELRHLFVKAVQAFLPAFQKE